MNRTYRLVFNKALGLVQVVSELANCRGKKSSGRSTVSGAHTGFSENLSAPFKLKAISIASALTVGSLLIIASPSSFAAPINNTSPTQTLTTTVGITGDAGTNGAEGAYGYKADDGGSGGSGITNTSTFGTLNNNVSITGGAGGAGGNGFGYYSNGGDGGGAGYGIDNGYGTITTLNNNGSITGGAGGAGGNGGGIGGNGRRGGHGIYNYYGTIATLNNNGSITGGSGGAGGVGGSDSSGTEIGGSGIHNLYYSTITTLNNNVSITGGAGGYGINNSYSTITTLNNIGSITGGAGVSGSINEPGGMNGGHGIYNGDYSTITTLNNSSSIIGGAGGAGFTGDSARGGAGGHGIYNRDYSAITTLNNNGSITGGNGGAAGSFISYYAGLGGLSGAGVNNLDSTITTLNNNGSITGGNGGAEGYGTVTYNGPGAGGHGINNGDYSTITTLNNKGSITGGNGGRRHVSGTQGGDGGAGVNNGYNGTITTLNNIGSITGGAGTGADNDGFGISNFGSIVTLDNAQGGDSLTPATTALTYTGNLPTNYNIIINSQSSYGQLFGASVTGSMNFGISNLSVASNTIYNGIRLTSILKGFDPVTITGYNGSPLLVSSLDNRYSGNLVYEGGGIWDLDILSAPIAGPSATDTQASLQSLAPKLRGAFSRQAIATNFANMNTYDCSLFDAKGVCVSVGGQQTYVDNPSSNMTSTVVVAGYKVSPNIRIGGFLNQNINNNTVSGVHISNANPMMGLFAVWNQKEDRLGYQVKIANAYQDKDVTTTRDVIDSAEAGIGRTNLNTQSYVGELSYAFLANEEKTLVRPYAALRYTRIKQDGYTEQTSAGVTAPLTYAGLADRSTTALVGVKLNHKLAEKVNLTGSIGIEQDLHHQVDNLTATGLAGLTSENFNDSIKRTRPVASIGAYYMPVKNQRISADIYYQQMPFQSTGSATAYVNYTIGF